MLGHLKSVIALVFLASIISAGPVPATDEITARGWEDDCIAGGGRFNHQACEGGTWKGGRKN